MWNMRYLKESSRLRRFGVVWGLYWEDLLRWWLKEVSGFGKRRITVNGGGLRKIKEGKKEKEDKREKAFLEQQSHLI